MVEKLDYRKCVQNLHLINVAAQDIKFQLSVVQLVLCLGKSSLDRH